MKAEDVENFPVPEPTPVRSVGSVGLSAAPAPLPGFPVDALPEPIAQWVEAEAIATQTPPDLAASMALAALATVGQTVAVVECGAGWTEHLPLWIFCALRSGERKSAVLRAALAPVVDVERQEVADARPRVAVQLAEREALEAQLKSTIRKVGEGKADRDELADIAERHEASPEPVLPRLLADDATPEALGGLLARHGSIAIVAAESALLDNLAVRYSDGRANLHLACQAYSGEPVKIDRRGREPEHLEEPLLTLGLCVQPHVLARITADETMREQGFLARAAVVVPRSNVGLRDTDPAPVPGPIADAYNACISRVATLRRADTTDTTSDPASSVGSVSVSQRLRFDPDAAEAFRNVRALHEPRLDPAGGDLASVATWANRHPGRIARIAGLLHLATHSPAEAISVETFSAAARIGEYLAAHAVAALAHDPAAAMVDRTESWLAERVGEVVSVRDLHRGPAGGGRGSADQARDVAARFEEAGRLRRQPDLQPEPTGGRPPSPAFEVVERLPVAPTPSGATVAGATAPEARERPATEAEEVEIERLAAKFGGVAR